MNVGFESAWHANFSMACSHAMATASRNYCYVIAFPSFFTAHFITRDAPFWGRWCPTASSSGTALLGVAGVSCKAAFRVFGIHSFGIYWLIPLEQKKASSKAATVFSGLLAFRCCSLGDQNCGFWSLQEGWESTVHSAGEGRRGRWS